MLFQKQRAVDSRVTGRRRVLEATHTYRSRSAHGASMTAAKLGAAQPPRPDFGEIGPRANNGCPLGSALGE
jgi:hypothetical protein